MEYQGGGENALEAFHEKGFRKVATPDSPSELATGSVSAETSSAVKGSFGTHGSWGRFSDEATILLQVDFRVRQ